MGSRARRHGDHPLSVLVHELTEGASLATALEACKENASMGGEESEARFSSKIDVAELKVMRVDDVVERLKEILDPPGKAELPWRRCSLSALFSKLAARGCLADRAYTAAYHERQEQIREARRQKRRRRR